MDIIEISERIQGKISESEKIRGVIRDRISESARASAEYDKAIGKTMVQLGFGVEFIIDGVKTGKVIASNADKIAKAICWEQKLAMDTADGLLKSAMKNLDAVASELNGYQSIYRHISNT
jgi:hypothetical protein